MNTPRVVFADGSWLELWGHDSTRVLTMGLALAGLDVSLCAAEDCTCDVGDGADLALDRDQVVALRDQLNVWLALGEV